MKAESLYCNLTSDRIAEMIRRAERFVCFIAPGIQVKPAKAMAEAAERLGREKIAVSLDFDEHVFRMGWGDVKAVEILRNVGIRIGDARGLRSGLVLVDQQGHAFTPTAKFLESETRPSLNALSLVSDQVRDLARHLIRTPSEDPDACTPMVKLPGVASEVVEQQLQEVKVKLEDIPPLEFDVARQVNVFSPYLQFVELRLQGVKLDRKRYTIPQALTGIGRFRDPDGRMKATFDLIGEAERNAVSASPLEKELDDIREEFTRPLPRQIGSGRVFLKAEKAKMEKRISDLRRHLAEYQAHLDNVLQNVLDRSKKHIIEYYTQMVLESPPHGLILHCGKHPESRDAQLWIDGCLSDFPTIDIIVNKMNLRVNYKDVTYETLSSETFVDWVKGAFRDVDWDKPLAEYKAAKGE